MSGRDARERWGDTYGTMWATGTGPDTCVKEARIVFNHYEEDLAEKDARIAELEAENLELAKHKTKFEVGDTVEYRIRDGVWGTAVVRDIDKYYDLTLSGGYPYNNVSEANLRLPQPKVTKDDVIEAATKTVDTWGTDAFSDAMEQLAKVQLAYRKQTEVAK